MALLIWGVTNEPSQQSYRTSFGLLDKVIEDKDQKAALAHEIATMSEKHANAVQMAQIGVNAAEAASEAFLKVGGVLALVGPVLLLFSITLLVSLLSFLSLP